MATILEYSKKRLQAFLEDISHLKGLEFPYPHSQQALEQIHDTLSNHLKAVEQLTEKSDPATVRAACKAAVSALFIYLPLLGFILRSTDVRNAFEIYRPLLRLSRQILGPSAKLILSSEWDYSPFTYLNIPILQEFVLIGLPAPESANPLLVSLAGHELGHPVWLQQRLAMNVSPEIESKILAEIQDGRWKEYSELFPTVKKDALTTDLFAKQTWLPAHEWALWQSEETFCDFLGLRILGESYLHAFAYLLAPNQGGGYRPVIYPNVKRRVGNLVNAAKEYQTPVPPNYEELFEDLPQPTDAYPQTKFLLELADAASQSVVLMLIKIANTVVNDAKIEEGNEDRVQAICKDFRDYIVPARDPVGLSDILNAGWKAFHDPNLWAEHPEIRDRDRTLKELLLKSIEVLEFKSIMKGSE